MLLSDVVILLRHVTSRPGLADFSNLDLKKCPSVPNDVLFYHVAKLYKSEYPWDLQRIACLFKSNAANFIYRIYTIITKLHFPNPIITIILHVSIPRYACVCWIGHMCFDVILRINTFKPIPEYTTK